MFSSLQHSQICVGICITQNFEYNKCQLYGYWLRVYSIKLKTLYASFRGGIFGDACRRPKSRPLPNVLHKYGVTLQFWRLRRFRTLKALGCSKLCEHVRDFAGGSLRAHAGAENAALKSATYSGLWQVFYITVYASSNIKLCLHVWGYHFKRLWRSKCHPKSSLGRGGGDRLYRLPVDPPLTLSIFSKPLSIKII